jgi:hypothetical protein
MAAWHGPCLRSRPPARHRPTRGVAAPAACQTCQPGARLRPYGRRQFAADTKAAPVWRGRLCPDRSDEPGASAADLDPGKRPGAIARGQLSDLDDKGYRNTVRLLHRLGLDPPRRIHAVLSPHRLAAPARHRSASLRPAAHPRAPGCRLRRGTRGNGHRTAFNVVNGETGLIHWINPALNGRSPVFHQISLN